MPVPVPFALTERLDGRDLVLAVRGELDLTSVPLLRDALAAALSRRPPRLQLDLSQVTFAQASALAAVVRARRRAHAQGTELVVLAGGSAVTRLLALTGLDTVLRPGLAAIAPKHLHDDAESLRRHHRRAGRLRVQRERGEDAVVLRLRGELDHGPGSLEPALHDALGAGEPVVLDLTELAFCDTQGLARLVRAARTARTGGVPLGVTQPNRPVRRLIEVTGTAQLLACP